MEILFTEQFEQAYEKLTNAEKRSVRKALALLGDNPKHPSLHVKKMQGGRSIWEARPSRRLRITFEMAGGNIVARNVGEHDKVLKRPRPDAKPVSPWSRVDRWKLAFPNSACPSMRKW